MKANGFKDVDRLSRLTKQLREDQDKNMKDLNKAFSMLSEHDNEKVKEYRKVLKHYTGKLQEASKKMDFNLIMQLQVDVQKALKKISDADNS